MQSDPGFAWTLIESLSLANQRINKFRKSFYFDVPNQDCSPNWSSYRLSKSKMVALNAASTSTHFRATCNFNASSKIGLQSYRDYLKVSFCAYNQFLSFPNKYLCVIVDYINIRGYSCSKCSIPIFSNHNHHLFIYNEKTRTMCGRVQFPNAVVHENNFGYYEDYNTRFSCSAKPTSTTIWWIGGTYFRKYQ